MKALIAMSGGVDSSVAAYLMEEKGYTGLGITMKLLGHAFTQEETGHRCCSLDDVEDARRVARQLGMPYYVFNFSRCFQDQVIDPWIQAYENGQTPNPCILCNRELKFGKLFQKARELGCDVMVTGHYARVTYDKTTGRWLLKKAMDQAKDQSYFLYTMTQEQLQHTVFPLGHLTKAQVRQIAAQHGFANAHKHDSQDVCFIGKEGCAGFLSSHAKTPCPQGPFVDREGHVLGTHKGIWQYTIGQRRGLHLAAGGTALCLCHRSCYPSRGRRSGTGSIQYHPHSPKYQSHHPAKASAPHAASGENPFPASGTVGHRHANGRRHAANSFRRAPAGHHKRAGGGFVRWRCRGGWRYHWVKGRILQTLQIPLYNGI